MSGEFLRAAMRLAILIFGVAVVTLPFQPPGSGEFVVTVIAAIIGGLFVLTVIGLLRWSAPPLPEVDDKGHRKALNGPSPVSREERDT